MWYIIFTADVDADTPSPEVDMLCDFTCPAVNHRMFVLEASGPDPWESAYVMRAELDTYGQFAIDGTYFQTPTGLYHIYSCWYGPYISWPSLLCISESMYRLIYALYGSVWLTFHESVQPLYGFVAAVLPSYHLSAHSALGEDTLRAYHQCSTILKRGTRAAYEP